MMRMGARMLWISPIRDAFGAAAMIAREREREASPVLVLFG